MLDWHFVMLVAEVSAVSRRPCQLPYLLMNPFVPVLFMRLGLIAFACKRTGAAAYGGASQAAWRLAARALEDYLEEALPGWATGFAGYLVVLAPTQAVG